MIHTVAGALAGVLLAVGMAVFRSDRARAAVALLGVAACAALAATNERAPFAIVYGALSLVLVVVALAFYPAGNSEGDTIPVAAAWGPNPDVTAFEERDPDEVTCQYMGP